MKKTVSFNLEEDIIKKIEEYQVINKLSSRSAALERIILKLDSINIDKSVVEGIVKEMINGYDFKNNNLNVTDEPVKEFKNKDLDNSIKDVFLDMPD